MDPITRHPRLDLPARLDDGAELFGVLERIGLVAIAPANSRRLVAAGEPLAKVLGRRFTEAQIDKALGEFDVSSVDRMAFKFATHRHNLIGR